jgi:hypothetical protein
MSPGTVWNKARAPKLESDREPRPMTELEESFVDTTLLSRRSHGARAVAKLSFVESVGAQARALARAAEHDRRSRFLLRTWQRPYAGEPGVRRQRQIFGPVNLQMVWLWRDAAFARSHRAAVRPRTRTPRPSALHSPSLRDIRAPSTRFSHSLLGCEQPIFRRPMPIARWSRRVEAPSPVVREGSANASAARSRSSCRRTTPNTAEFGSIDEGVIRCRSRHIVRRDLRVTHPLDFLALRCLTRDLLAHPNHHAVLGLGSAIVADLRRHQRHPLLKGRGRASR